MTEEVDGSGEKNHAKDYRGAEASVIRLTPPKGVVYALTAMTVFVKTRKVDKLKPKAEPQLYGNLPALENGIRLKIFRGDVVLVDTTGGVPIKTNADWLKIGQKYDYIKGRDTEYWISRWCFLPVGEPAFLDGTLFTEFAFLLQDDFSLLDEQYFIAFGYARPK
jgi:hypothetical protein